MKRNLSVNQTGQYITSSTSTISFLLSFHTSFLRFKSRELRIFQGNVFCRSVTLNRNHTSRRDANFSTIKSSNIIDAIRFLSTFSTSSVNTNATSVNTRAIRMHYRVSSFQFFHYIFRSHLTFNRKYDRRSVFDDTGAKRVRMGLYPFRTVQYHHFSIPIFRISSDTRNFGDFRIRISEANASKATTKREGLNSPLTNRWEARSRGEYARTTRWVVKDHHQYRLVNVSSRDVSFEVFCVGTRKHSSIASNVCINWLQSFYRYALHHPRREYGGSERCNVFDPTSTGHALWKLSAVGGGFLRF